MTNLRVHILTQKQLLNLQLKPGIRH
ncbi:hypothetical protein ACHAWC_003433 [Mediolabrus comicus]